ncbi:hypothetical protein ON058_04290 [Demequina sp. B12]|uniref:hypothetical protein n=1 Tax=Demequina sp. B12 TaxID=2992757 RepID=UPI00237A7C93|nr:hypothetical protein [Demequina sp. B12]MDE0572631.1 hypothetical protein [Demequina sp. B12]
MKDSVGYVIVALAGLLTATVGAVAYRSVPPWGVVMAIVMVLAAAVFARAWLSWTGLGVFAGLWVLLTAVWSANGPGNSVLIAQDGLGIAWLAGSAVAIVIAAVIPVKLLVGDDVTT